jgi:hypothetical protein
VRDERHVARGLRSTAGFGKENPEETHDLALKALHFRLIFVLDMPATPS